MFQENIPSDNHHYQSSQSSGLHEDDLIKKIGNKKLKTIQKEKSKSSQFYANKSDNSESDTFVRSQLTKEQRKQIQKQKNRVAAQLSRDRQKKYVEDLEIKIYQLQKQLESKICHRCKSVLSDHSTNEEQDDKDSSNNIIPLIDQPENVDFSFLNVKQAVQIDQVPLVRDNSGNDQQWANIGRYFCIILIVFSIALMSSSVSNQSFQESQSHGQVARILTQNQVCEKPEKKIQKIGKNRNVAPSSTIGNFQFENLPFVTGLSQPVEQCKNSFWRNYLQNAKSQSSQIADYNLVNCNSPHLVHISSLYQNSLQPAAESKDKWTFLITNPTVTHSHLQVETGQYYVDQVNYLNGVYQMIAEKVVLKKVMGKNCLA